MAILSLGAWDFVTVKFVHNPIPDITKVIKDKVVTKVNICPLSVLNNFISHPSQLKLFSDLA